MNKYDTFGVMIDCSRNSVMTVDSVKDIIKLLAKIGYNSLQLYTEDTYEVEGHPYFGYMRGRYTQAELREIDSFAKGYGIEVIPCIQTLAHLSQVTRWMSYYDCTDCTDILLVDEQKTYELIESMIKSVSQCFSSRRINIGMDEAHLLGAGKFVDKHGYEERYSIFKRHLEKVIKIAEKYGFKPMTWSDMFFRVTNKDRQYYDFENELPANIAEAAPKGVDLIYWDYYHFKDEEYDFLMRQHLKFSNDIWFAGAFWTFNGYTPQYNMSHKHLIPAMKACDKYGIKNVFITMWGDGGGECSRFTSVPTLILAYEYAHGNYDMDSIKQKCLEITGIPYDAFMDLELPNKLGPHEILNHNPGKYLLFQDFLMGLLDSTVVPEQNRYEEYSEILTRHLETCGEKWRHLFKTQRDLCRVLSLKIDIGINLRKAYLKDNKAELKALTEVIREIVSRIETLYNSCKAQWHKENKPHGFDIQDLRFGGIQKRGLTAIERITKYINGEIERIEELEEERLDLLCRDAEEQKKPLSTTRHYLIATPNVL